MNKKVLIGILIGLTLLAVIVISMLLASNRSQAPATPTTDPGLILYRRQPDRTCQGNPNLCHLPHLPPPSPPRRLLMLCRPWLLKLPRHY